MSVWEISMDMNLTIDKDAKTTLCVQVKNNLIGMIRSGQLAAGKRMSGERQLAETFGISRGTAVSALKLLEDEGYIERIAARGTFVADDVSTRLKSINLLFPFPEKGISLEHLSYAGFCCNMEFYQGMMQAAVDEKVQISFRHFEDSEDRHSAVSQLKEAGRFDGAVFINWQLKQLKELLLKNKVPCALIATPFSGEHADSITYDRDMALRQSAEYIASRGYKNVGIIRYAGHTAETEQKMEILLEELASHGLAIDRENIYAAPDSKEEAYKLLSKVFPRSKKALPDIFFCESVCHPSALFRISSDRGWQVGRDIKIFGYGSDTSFRDIIPSLTYLRIPYFEMGKEACSVIARKVRNGSSITERISIKASIVQGRSA